MKLSAFLLSALLWPVAGVAAVIEVRTGEHADFSRVVLSIPEGAEWQMGRRAQGYVVRLPEAESFVLDGFFDLIPRTRITAVSEDASKGELRLDVSCPCNAQAYLFRPDLLVIDVRDGLPSRISSFELSLDRPAAQETRAQDRPTPPPYQVPRQRLLPLIASVAPEIQEVRSRPEAEESQLPMTPKTANGNAQILDDRLTELEDAIVAGLGDALSGGLLEGNLQSPFAAMQNDDVEALLPGTVFPGIQARTSVDPNAVSPADAAVQTQTGQSCQPDSYFDVASWRDERPFFAQLNEARRALVPEFERIDEEAVTNLARLYVSFGFGREAMQTLEIDGAMSLARQYLVAMAMIVDGDQPEQGLFAGQVSCPSQVSLWAVLSADDIPFDAQVDRVAVLTAFRSLPDTLKTGLSVPLSEKLLAIGDTDTALQLLRNPPEPGPVEPDRVLADAALLDALGEEKQAMAAVADAAQTNVRNSPALMIRFFEDGIEAGRVFSDEDFLLADALWFEQSDTPLALDMVASQFEAYLSVGRFDDAYSLIRRFDAVEGQRLLNTFYLAAANDMGAAEFLRLVLPETDAALEPATRIATAQRLLELGFPRQSQAYLDDLPQRAPLDAQLYLQAQNAIALGQPEDAIALLADRASEKAMAIREDAIEAQVTRAALLPDETGRALDPMDSDVRSLLGDFDDQVRQTAIDPEMPLTSSRALLEGSVRTRERLEELLQTFEAPEVQ